MRLLRKQSIEAAVQNVSSHGDTDVAPYPIENHWFYDRPNDVTSLLEYVDENFDALLGAYPVVFVKSLSAVGYTGFRATTQADPIWNAYLLALTMEIGPEIESARVALDQARVFSYRFAPDEKAGTIFSKKPSWFEYQKSALTRAADAEFVLSTDISDFYGRIYHHRLENALSEATDKKRVVRRIMQLLSTLSSGTSYGVPVGGNSARLLAELLLNRSDRLLLAHNIDFIRFVDDYYVFAKSRQEAQVALVRMSEFLLIEGLSLSRTKTRLMTRSEFERSSPVAEHTVAESESESETRRFLHLRLSYDPYSATADQDYDELSRELLGFDILGMLTRELAKSRIDESIVRQLVKSIRFLHPGVRVRAVGTILDNIELLYPIFSTVAIILKALLAELEEPVKRRVLATFARLLERESYIVLVPVNLAFAIRVLAYSERSESIDRLLIRAYDRGDMMIKREVVLAMARRKSAPWLSIAIRRFSGSDLWERRALLAASYTLGDEGRHWRRGIQEQLGPVGEKFQAWLSDKNNGKVWELPL